jgi:hypothetical protein
MGTAVRHLPYFVHINKTLFTRQMLALIQHA